MKKNYNFRSILWCAISFFNIYGSEQENDKKPKNKFKEYLECCFKYQKKKNSANPDNFDILVQTALYSYPKAIVHDIDDNFDQEKIISGYSLLYSPELIMSRLKVVYSDTFYSRLESVHAAYYYAILAHRFFPKFMQMIQQGDKNMRSQELPCGFIQYVGAKSLFALICEDPNIMLVSLGVPRPAEELFNKNVDKRIESCLDLIFQKIVSIQQFLNKYYDCNKQMRMPSSARTYRRQEVNDLIKELNGYLSIFCKENYFDSELINLFSFHKKNSTFYQENVISCNDSITRSPKIRLVDNPVAQNLLNQANELLKKIDCD